MKELTISISICDYLFANLEDKIHLLNIKKFKIEATDNSEDIWNSLASVLKRLEKLEELEIQDSSFKSNKFQYNGLL